MSGATLAPLGVLLVKNCNEVTFYPTKTSDEFSAIQQNETHLPRLWTAEENYLYAGDRVAPSHRSLFLHRQDDAVSVGDVSRRCDCLRYGVEAIVSTGALYHRQ